MSFGASPSDIIIVVTFARRLYRQCKNAGTEYLEISREVRGLHTVLRLLKYQVEDPESVFNRDDSIYARELAPVIGDCDFTLRQLDELLMRYGRLSDPTAGKGERLWDKLRFGSAQMDQLGDIRMKLINHKTSITVFLETVQLHQSSRVSATLDIQSGQLDLILDKVDNIAARIGQKTGSIMTTYDDDDKEVWKQFRRELVAEGFSSDVLQQHKDVLRAYIREMDQNGLLVDMPPDPKARQPPGVNPEVWLDTLSLASQGAPPSFDSLHTPSEDAMAKEMVVSEDNMKFPPSMKLERPKPDSAPQSPSAEAEQDGEAALRRQLAIPRIDPQLGGSDNPTYRSPSPIHVPKLVTSVNSPTKGKRVFQEYLPPPTPPKSIISTSDIMEGLYPPPDRRTSRIGSGSGNEDNLSLRTASPSGSPTASRHASFADDAIPRSSTQSTKNHNLAPDAPRRGTSPSSQLGTSPSSPSGTYPGSNRLRPPASPRTMPADPPRSGGASALAPDSNGRPIPLDAKWTQIKRSLISTEILDQDKRRYEVRPEFVAILGVLSRTDIEDLADRSYALRASRKRPVPIQPPKQPPRPQARRYSSSSNDEAFYDTASDDDHAHDERRRDVGRDARDRELRHRSHSESYPPGPGSPIQQNYTTQRPEQQSPHTQSFPNQSYQQGPIPRSQPRQSNYIPVPVPVPYPNSFSPFPQPQPGMFQPHYVPPQMPQSQSFQQPQGQGGYLGVPQDEPRRRKSDPGKHGKLGGKDQDGKGDKKGEKGKEAKADNRVRGKRRWGENLTAAGIGGAAVSLLSVLSEAAEGL